jgi:hypothetical protein
MLNVIMLSVIMLSVIMLNVVMLSVVASSIDNALIELKGWNTYTSKGKKITSISYKRKKLNLDQL